MADNEPADNKAAEETENRVHLEKDTSTHIARLTIDNQNSILYIRKCG